MDPQQRILLHVAYEALEDAGYVADSTPSFLAETFGCYIGAATHDYLHNLRNSIDVYYSTGEIPLVCKMTCFSPNHHRHFRGIPQWTIILLSWIERSIYRC